MMNNKAHFEFEYPVCQTTGKKCENIFIGRGYKAKGDSKFFAVTTIIKRENDLWEPTAWLTNDKRRGYHAQGINHLIELGYRVSGTFEERRFSFFEKYFGFEFLLKPIKKIKKWYNGEEVSFIYIEFKPRIRENNAYDLMMEDLKYVEC